MINDEWLRLSTKRSRSEATHRPVEPHSSFITHHSPSPMKTLIIDDERLARNELRRLLENFPKVDIVGEAANADEALRTATRFAVSGYSNAGQKRVRAVAGH